MIGLTKTVAREFAARNITCNAVAPGFIASDMTAAIDPKYEEAILGQIPLSESPQFPRVTPLGPCMPSCIPSAPTGIITEGGYKRFWAHLRGRLAHLLTSAEINGVCRPKCIRHMHLLPVDILLPIEHVSFVSFVF